MNWYAVNVYPAASIDRCLYQRRSVRDRTVPKDVAFTVLAESGRLLSQFRRSRGRSPVQTGSTVAAQCADGILIHLVVFGFFGSNLHSSVAFCYVTIDNKQITFELLGSLCLTSCQNFFNKHSNELSDPNMNQTHI